MFSHPPLFDHLLLKVSDFARSRAFYEAALGALGLKISLEGENSLAFSTGGTTQFMLKAAPEKDVSRNIHIAFTAATHKQVDGFFEAAMRAGGRQEGAPGLRHYHEGYYAAYVLDPDGNNIEAVCHKRA